MIFPSIEKKTGNGERQCLICPHNCILKMGQRGKCGIRLNNGKEIMSLNYSNMANIAIEPIEKKPFKKFVSEGTRTLSIGSWGCNLSCKYCENYSISQNQPYCKSLKATTPSQLKEIADDFGCEVICLTYNEPIICPEYIRDIYDSFGGKDIRLALKTNAFANKEIWSYLIEIVDAVNIDWKGSKNSFMNISKANDYVLNDRIVEAMEKCHVEISVPLYYQNMEDMRESLFSLGKLLQKDLTTPCHLLKVYPSFEMNNNRVTSEGMIDGAKAILEKCGLKYIYTLK